MTANSQAFSGFVFQKAVISSSLSIISRTEKPKRTYFSDMYTKKPFTVSSLGLNAGHQGLCSHGLCKHCFQQPNTCPGLRCQSLLGKNDTQEEEI